MEHPKKGIQKKPSLNSASSISSKDKSFFQKFSEIHEEIFKPIIELIQSSTDENEKITHLDEIRQVIIDKKLSWGEYLDFLEEEETDNFQVLFKTAILKKDKDLLLGFLSCMNLEELSE